MLKIFPVKRNSQVINHVQKVKKNFISSSFFTLSLLTPIIMNSCSKYAINPEEDIFEKADTTIIKDDSNMNVAIDSSTIRQYTYYI